MLAYLAFGLAGIGILLLIHRPRLGVLFIILAKPTIDTAWNVNIGGINALELIGVAVPLLVLGNLVLHRPDEFRRLPGGLVWSIFMLANVAGFAIMLASGKGYGALETFFRVLNGMAG